mgnify:CR=1 FL=1
MFFRGTVFWLSLAIATLCVVVATFPWKEGLHREANSYVLALLFVLLIGVLFRPGIGYLLSTKKQPIDQATPPGDTIMGVRSRGETGTSGL